MSTLKLTSPHKYRERMLFVGGGGAGKTTAALSVIEQSAYGDAYVVDIDYSRAWARAVDEDFDTIRDRVQVSEVEPEWQPMMTEIERIVEAHGTDEDAWLIIDSISPSYEYVQSWYVQSAMGNDMGAFMAQLRAESKTIEAYQKSLGENMNWPAIKKEYSRLYRALSKWKGHLILTAEAKSIKGERDADLLALYGPIGYKPVGEGRLHHVTSTSLFFADTSGGYKFSTIKDRNRDKVKNEKVDAIEDGGFGSSYLWMVAGWRPTKKKSDTNTTGATS